VTLGPAALAPKGQVLPAVAILVLVIGRAA
jgi:hypothetical protein